MRRRQKICLPIAGFFLLVAIVFWLFAVWQQDLVRQKQLAETGGLLLIPTVAFAVASVRWENF